jgi:trk system potassium uptake protein TrkA
MRVLVVGAGRVGTTIAVELAPDHEVTVVDVDPERVEELTYSADVLAVEGSGTSLATLQSAGVAEADVLVACTDDDEVNLLTCGTAKTVGDAFTIARVRSPEYLDTWRGSTGAFGVDFVVSPVLLTAADVVGVVGLPAAVDVDPFVGGLVQMAEFEVEEGCELVGQTVAEADSLESVTVAALVRDEEVVIPDGDTVLAAGDRAVVIGRQDGVEAFAATATADADRPRDVVVVGGSDVGYHVADLLVERGLSPRLVERDPRRARELAERLPGVVVLEHDATDADFLVEEGIDRADVVVAATDSDEKNLLVAMLAKRVGAGRTVAVVEEGEYDGLFGAAGIDVVVNPREATAEEVVRFTRESNVENLSLVEGRKAEVLEFEVDADSVLAGRPIRESVADLPVEAVVGAVTRRGEFVVPRGDTTVEVGDHVVVFVAADALEAVVELI